MKQKATQFGLLAIATLAAIPARAATVPPGFAHATWVPGLSEPTAMDFASDGRLFVCEEGGALRVIRNGMLLGTPFVKLSVDSDGERGLLGIAFDPGFAQNHYLYLYYTAKTPTIHNRVSRFTANLDVAVPGSEKVLLDLPTLGATNHNGGAIHFGRDGKLYVAVGDNAVSTRAQSKTNPFGKLLRLNKDGTVPADNPFNDGTAGPNYDAIWTLGLRNPFTFAVQRGTGRLYINDVGETTWEEINVGATGANYGWPDTEGPIEPPVAGLTGPLFAYEHDGPDPDLTGCAITGGTFYNPATAQFPASYTGKYFFQDLCNGWIRVLTPSNHTAAGFATGLSAPVDLKVGPDSALYSLCRGDGAVHRFRFTNGDTTSPNISFTDPTNGATVTALNSVTGKAIDNTGGSGLRQVTLRIFRQSDQKYWDGTAWITANTVLPTTLSGTDLITWTRNSGLPAGANLPAGKYTLQARAYDNALNAGTTTATITVAPSE